MTDIGPELSRASMTSLSPIRRPASGRPNGAGPKHCSRPPFDHTNAPNRRVVVEPGKASRIEEDGEVRGFAVFHGDEPDRVVERFRAGQRKGGLRS